MGGHVISPELESLVLCQMRVNEVYAKARRQFCIKNRIRHTKLPCVMGNLGKPLNFPLVWARKEAVEPRRSNWYCAARFTCWEGNFCVLSQSITCRVVRSFWYLKAVTVNLVRRGPIPGCSLVLGVLGVTCEWLLWRAYTWGYFKPGELGEPCRSKVVRLCGWLVR